MNTSKFGKKIENVQYEKGIDTKELAKISGISRQSIYLIKRSKKPHPSTVHRLAKALDIPIKELIDAL